MDGHSYRSVEAAHARGLAWGPCADWVQALLSEGRTLHAWAAAQEDRGELRGRGTTYAIRAPVPGPDGHERWAVRRYLRGGLVASHLHDRYFRLGTPRPQREAEASAAARRRGIPTPAVVAGAWYPSGAFYRADLVTEVIPGSVNLAGLLFGAPRGEDAVGVLERVGRLVREAGARGLDHPDLNARNVLVRPGADEPECWIIDLDGARVHDVPSASFGSIMLFRLSRSLRKLGRAGNPLSDHEAAALRAGFEGL